MTTQQITDTIATLTQAMATTPPAVPAVATAGCTCCGGKR